MPSELATGEHNALLGIGRLALDPGADGGGHGLLDTLFDLWKEYGQASGRQESFRLGMRLLSKIHLH
ncbi:MAG: hypothetical protein RLY93_03560 [Sumerlaeia bacterium]